LKQTAVTCLVLTISVNGTSGEGMSMTVAERKSTTEAWAAAVKETKQVLMVQVGGACLKDVQEMVNSTVSVIL
jgi:N-acetylneuraminate lyase